MLKARFPFKRNRLRFFRFSFTHATHATQAIAFEWKPGLSRVCKYLDLNFPPCFSSGFACSETVLIRGETWPVDDGPNQISCK